MHKREVKTDFSWLISCNFGRHLSTKHEMDRHLWLHIYGAELAHVRPDSGLKGTFHFVANRNAGFLISWYITRELELCWDLTTDQ